MLNVKTYVINAPDLVVAVQRNSKNLLFSPILAAALPRLFDVDKDVTSLSVKNMRDVDGEWTNIHPLNMANYVHLLPGPNLDSMIWKMQMTLNPLMNQLQEQTKGDEATVVGMYAWIKKSFGLATTEAIYGRENPFKLQPGLLDNFWYVWNFLFRLFTFKICCADGANVFREMDDGFTLLLVHIMPWLVARKAYKARQRLFDAMNGYFARNWRDDACELIRARYDAFHKSNIPVDAIARYEVGDSIAIMINTVPAIFWVLNYVYWESALLEELRAEIAASVSITTDEQTGTKTHHLDVKRLQEECELLMSTYQEVLRLQTDNVSARWVVRDTMINDRYLLRKDSVVQIPGAVIHQDPAIWGPDVKEFNPERFLKGAAKHHPGAFRVFGGGATLCPGRNFAVAELISFVAMFIMRFDVNPINYGWRKSLAARSNLVDSIPSPSSDINVCVKTREGFEKDEWVFEASA